MKRPAKIPIEEVTLEKVQELCDAIDEERARDEPDNEALSKHQYLLIHAVMESPALSLNARRYKRWYKNVDMESFE